MVDDDEKRALSLRKLVGSRLFVEVQFWGGLAKRLSADDDALF